MDKNMDKIEESKKIRSCLLEYTSYFRNAEAFESFCFTIKRLLLLNRKDNVESGIVLTIQEEVDDAINDIANGILARTGTSLSLENVNVPLLLGAFFLGQAEA